MPIIYGVNDGCSLASLSYFDPIKCFRHDLMHVASEGVLNDACCLLLRHSILDTNTKLNLETVNYDITNLKSDREFTVPPPIHLIEVVELKKLLFSSSELICLAACLPLVLSKFVNFENSHNYANFFLQLEILSSLKCYSFTEVELSKLEEKMKYTILFFAIVQSRRKIDYSKTSFINAFFESNKTFSVPSVLLVLLV